MSTPANPTATELNPSTSVSMRSEPSTDSSLSGSGFHHCQAIPQEVQARWALREPLDPSLRRSASGLSVSQRRALIEKEVLTPLRWEEIDRVPDFTEIVE